jgi:dihydrofolate reductase
MSKIRYGVAMSLDGYIAGPNGEADWIVGDPDLNFAEIWARFDTFLMGRLTYEAAITGMGKKAFRGMKVAVASRLWRLRTIWLYLPS